VIRTLRSEWIKLRTVTVNWVLVLLAVMFPLVVATLNALFADLSFERTSHDAASLIAGLSVVSAMLLGAMSAISLTAEYGHNTIRPTYAATPHRLRVIGAKLIVNSVVVLAIVLGTVFAAWGVSSVIRSNRDAPVSLGDDGVLRPLLAVALLAVVVALFGFGLGLIIRNSPATVTILLLWPLLIESLIGALFLAVRHEGWTRWLPYRAGISAAVGDGNGGDGPFREFGWPQGMLWFAAVALALCAVGTWLDERRDA
jgi:ABC-2 type transport system permease protein